MAAHRVFNACSQRAGQKPPPASDTAAQDRGRGGALQSSEGDLTTLHASKKG